MSYLSQVLPLLVLPMGVVVLLLAWGTATRRRAPLVAALLLLWASSTSLVAGALIDAVQDGLVRQLPAEKQPADAIVVLSGGRALAPGPAAVSEWTDADRYFGGLELWRAGRAPLLVFTANWLPWAPAAPTEGDILAAFARDAGVPSAQLLVTTRVSNTADEARAVAAALRDRGQPAARLLLVTSAFHMARATRVFEAQGLRVDPYPVDFKGPQWRGSLLTIVPDPSSFQLTHTALRELYGRAYYRLVGR